MYFYIRFRNHHFECAFSQVKRVEYIYIYLYVSVFFFIYMYRCMYIYLLFLFLFYFIYLLNKGSLLFINISVYTVFSLVIFTNPYAIIVLAIFLRYYRCVIAFSNFFFHCHVYRPIFIHCALRSIRCIIHLFHACFHYNISYLQSCMYSFLLLFIYQNTW